MKKQVWVIDNCYVSEPFLGGIQLGDINDGYKIPDDVEVIHISQIRFDEMMEDFYKLNGHYPDQ